MAVIDYRMSSINHTVKQLIDSVWKGNDWDVSVFYQDLEVKIFQDLKVSEDEKRH